MAVAVGIDLGTTNTVVAAVSDGVASVLADGQGARLLPSVVAFDGSGAVVVGHRAAERRLTDAANTVYSVKRLIGRPWDSPEVQDARVRLPFELCEGPNAGTAVAVRGETLSLPEISAFVLREAKAIAEAALGGPAERAVITVPANFNDLQRAATKMAGGLAGLEVLRILNEPTAAALAYGTDGKAHERVAVYDFGGGTLDVTVLDLASNVFEVLATAGDGALGGDDLDVIVAERMAGDLLEKHRYDARADPMAFGRLRILGERVKRELSSREDYELVAADVVPARRGASVPWRFRMTRSELEWSSLQVVERTFKVCERALQAAAIGPGDLDRVILVGGGTRMPLVARKVEQFFGRPPVVRINPDEVVALGASIQADLLDRSRGPRAGGPLHPRIDGSSVLAPPRERPLDGEPPEGEPPLELPIVRATGGGVPRAAPPLELPIVRATGGGVPRAAPRDGAPVRAAIAPAAAPVDPEPAFERKEDKALVFDIAPDRRVPSLAPASSARAAASPKIPRVAGLDASLERSRDRAAPSPPMPPPIAPPAPRPPAHADPADAGRSEGAIGSAGAARAPLLIDVTPLSLTVETVGGFCDRLIEANTPVPCDRTRNFATASDGQTAVRVRVAQGESKRFEENVFLGELELSGIAAAARGQTQIAVTFEIDVDGILNVRARDLRTDRETKARIQLAGAQTDPADLEAMRLRQAAHRPLDSSDRQGPPARG